VLQKLGGDLIPVDDLLARVLAVVALKERDELLLDGLELRDVDVALQEKIIEAIDDGDTCDVMLGECPVLRDPLGEFFAVASVLVMLHALHGFRVAVSLQRNVAAFAGGVLRDVHRALTLAALETLHPVFRLVRFALHGTASVAIDDDLAVGPGTDRQLLISGQPARAGRRC